MLETKKHKLEQRNTSDVDETRNFKIYLQSE